MTWVFFVFVSGVKWVPEAKYHWCRCQALYNHDTVCQVYDGHVVLQRRNFTFARDTVRVECR